MTSGSRGPTGLDYFTEDNSADVVIARNAAADPRLAQVMESATRHLHAFVKEVEPTQDEWLAAIGFLTAVGKTCTDTRQEWILLSDTLGVSMLVDAIVNRKPNTATKTTATESTVLGPFHVADAPPLPDGAHICLTEGGAPLLVECSVVDDAGAPIPGALVDVWQADSEGFYDVQQPDTQPAMNLRGIFTTQADGSFRFVTTRPVAYPVPDDGPVGKMLAALGRHPWRPAHIHFIVGAQGFEPVVTHLFDRESDYLGSDAVFGVKESLIADIVTRDDPALAARHGLPNPFLYLNWRFVLAPAGGRS